MLQRINQKKLQKVQTQFANGLSPSPTSKWTEVQANESKPT